MEELKWTTVKTKLEDIVPNEDNPRKISKEEEKMLAEDIKQVGHFKPLIVDMDNTIVGGNQRYKQLVKEYGKEFEVEISKPNRKLTEEERKKVIILDNRHRGRDDIEIMGNEYDQILAELNYPVIGKVDIEEMWAGMPEFDQEDDGPVRTLLVHFEAHEDVKKFAKIVGQSLTEKTKYIWFPRKEQEKVSDLEYS
jgi:cephalosporin hydroxylase